LLALAAEGNFQHQNNRTMNQLHRISGIYLSFFITLHLCNHLVALVGVEQHIAVMYALRVLYKNPLIEGGLLIAIGAQLVSGLRLAVHYYRLKKQKKALAGHRWKRWQVYSGLYLTFFLLAHTTATLSAYYGMGIDTNFYFAAMVVQFFPYALFFVPYYSLGIVAYVLHLLCLWRLRQRQQAQADKKARIILVLGGLLAFLIVVGLCQRVVFPRVYLELVGH
jgi:succinate dehydrogenase/fumarate reductase cytochrome b subunit